MFERVAIRFSAWAERWLPDAFVFALLATVIVFAAGLTVGHASPVELTESWGKGFWDLTSFTMQMALVIVTGYVLASSRPIARVIERLARLPRTARGATVLLALFSLAASWINWGFSLVFGALLAREMARLRPEADYRALAASSFLGLGSVWAQGLSSSAALLMASAGTMQPRLRDIVSAGGVVPGGVIPLRSTLFTWQSATAVAIETAIVAGVVAAYTPVGPRARTAAALGVTIGPLVVDEPETTQPTPGERLERSSVLGLAVFALGAAYLALRFARAPDRLGALDLGTINLGFLMLGVLLHGTPARLMHAVRAAVPATWGVILQFPFYAGIAGMITYTGLNARIAHVFVSASTHESFPPLVAAYSVVLGIFVPSAGAKWLIEAPYVMQASHDLHCNLAWTVDVYNLGEALANLVQPFWMLPTLAILGLRARDVMGFTLVVFVVLAPVVLVMVTLLGATLPYPL